jgi:hypothetical protein
MTQAEQQVLARIEENRASLRQQGGEPETLDEPGARCLRCRRPYTWRFGQGDCCVTCETSMRGKNVTTGL